MEINLQLYVSSIGATTSPQPLNFENRLCPELSTVPLALRPGHPRHMTSLNPS